MTIKVAGTDIIDQSRNILTATLKNYTETTSALGTLAAGTTNINLANGTVFTATLPTSGTVTFTFSTGVTTGAASFLLFLTNAGSGSATLSWPGTVKWTGGTVPDRTTTVSRTDIWSFSTLDNGTSWYGNIALFNFA